MNNPEPATGGYSAADEVGVKRKRRTRFERMRIALAKAPLSAWFGLIVVSCYVVVALFAPLLAPYGEADIFPTPYAAWGGEHFFGTDQIGRFALMLLSIFGSTISSLIIIIAVLDSTRVFRLTRSVAVNVVVMDYVEAARLRGEKLGWIMRREILPNILPPLIAEFGLRFSFVFLTIAALSFLGVGIQPPTADWGSMVRENASLIQFAKYDIKAGLTPLLPAAAIALLTVAVNFIVDWFLHQTSGLRDDG